MILWLSRIFWKDFLSICDSLKLNWIYSCYSNNLVLSSSNIERGGTYNFVLVIVSFIAMKAGAQKILQRLLTKIVNMFVLNALFQIELEINLHNSFLWVDAINRYMFLLLKLGLSCAAMRESNLIYCCWEIWGA